MERKALKADGRSYYTDIFHFVESCPIVKRRVLVEMVLEQNTAIQDIVEGDLTGILDPVEAIMRKRENIAQFIFFKSSALKPRHFLDQIVTQIESLPHGQIGGDSQEDMSRSQLRRYAQEYYNRVLRREKERIVEWRKRGNGRRLRRIVRSLCSQFSVEYSGGDQFCAILFDDPQIRTREWPQSPLLYCSDSGEDNAEQKTDTISDSRTVPSSQTIDESLIWLERSRIVPVERNQEDLRVLHCLVHIEMARSGNWKALKILHECLSTAYQKAHDRLRNGRSNHGNMKLRNYLAGLWCLYAHVLAEMGYVVYAATIIEASSSCPFVGNHGWICVVWARLVFMHSNEVSTAKDMCLKSLERARAEAPVSKLGVGRFLKSGRQLAEALKEIAAGESSTFEIEGSLQRIAQLPATIMDSQYIFNDRNSATLLCHELNRLSEYEDKSRRFDLSQADIHCGVEAFPLFRSGTVYRQSDLEQNAGAAIAVDGNDCDETERKRKLLPAATGNCLACDPSAGSRVHVATTSKRITSKRVHTKTINGKHEEGCLLPQSVTAPAVSSTCY